MNLPTDTPRRLIRKFEGGAIYEAEKNDRFLVIVDEGSLLDFLSEEDRLGCNPITVHDFKTVAERRDFLIERGWVPKMTTEQQAFIDAQIFSMTLMATVQRNRHLYRKTASDGEKQVFRVELRKELERIIEQYVVNTPEPQHFANIEGLANHISAISPSALDGERFKIGAAQKALNLYLKYMWCMGRIRTPPHCPFDAIVLSAIGWDGKGWTQEVDIEKYKSWVSLAKEKANGSSLAEWELQEFNKQLGL
jgi:hypothetical protein